MSEDAVQRLIGESGLRDVDFDSLSHEEALVIFGDAVRVAYMDAYVEQVAERMERVA